MPVRPSPQIARPYRLEIGYQAGRQGPVSVQGLRLRGVQQTMTEYGDTGDLFDGDESRRRRDEGMERVSYNAGDFTARVRGYVVRLPFDCELTGEDIRRGCEAHGILPHHSNAWGAAINSCVRAGLIVRTGRTTTMKRKTSNARRNPIYRVR
jgi:hypothetical protein